MKLAPDTILHLQAGALLAFLLLGVGLLALHVTLGAAIAAGSVTLAWGVERYQAIRGEGDPSDRDLIASASPGLVLAGVIEAWSRWP